jgi:hypothetical protein
MLTRAVGGVVLISLSRRRCGMPTKIELPFFPIIYVRGYAGDNGEIEDTVAEPYGLCDFALAIIGNWRDQTRTAQGRASHIQASHRYNSEVHPCPGIS